MNENPVDPKTNSEEFKLTVPASDEGTRLDAFLVAHCEGFSRTRIHGDMGRGLVAVDDRIRPKGYRLRGGEHIIYQPAPLPELKAVPQDLPLDIIYQDEDILVVNKAAGMVVHPAVGHPDGTLVNALLHHLGRVPAGEDPLRPGIVHRLDRDTSGLMVVALSSLAHQHLSEQLADRRMGRTYLTVSWGQWDPLEGLLRGDIGRDPRHRQRMAVVTHMGRPAATHYEVIEDFGFVQLCRLRLETGRTHQIRVHFAHNHHPVLGDPLYGDDGRARGVHGLDRQLAGQMVRCASRLMLHASALHLEHPHDGRPMIFHAPLPADMQAVLALLGSGYNPDGEHTDGPLQDDPDVLS